VGGIVWRCAGGMDFRKMGGVGYVHKVENIKTQHALQELAGLAQDQNGQRLDCHLG
jgi:hypothetical protein